MNTESFSQLSPADQRLLDALVECGFDPAAVPVRTDAERARLARLVSLLELLEDYPVDDVNDTLVHATLARIDRAEHDASARRRFGAAMEDPGRARSHRPLRARLPDFITVAAVILIAASIVVPVSSHLSRQALDGRCANNIRLIANAFGQYAGDNAGAMPTAMANIGFDMSWDKIRNVINLNPLVQNGYCEFGHLSCPGHHDSGVGYSYQWQAPGRKAMWGLRPVGVILGDRNPVIDAALLGTAIPPLSMSLNHGGRGQNVLANDGSTSWIAEPVVGTDNIWLPQGVSFLRMGDQPSGARDTFLAH